MDIMLDIETLGTEPGSVITQIAAVQFDPVEGTLGKCLVLNVDIQSSLDLGMTVSGSTLSWWMLQSPETFKSISSEPKEKLPAALLRLSDFILNSKLENIWGFGANFDITLLEVAYKKCNYETLQAWKYPQVSCLRTLTKYSRIQRPKFLSKEEYKALGLCSDIKDTEKVLETVPVKHHALWDAVLQAYWALQILCPVELAVKNFKSNT